MEDSRRVRCRIRGGLVTLEMDREEGGGEMIPRRAFSLQKQPQKIMGFSELNGTLAMTI